jgi:hypothetical protein
MKSTWQQITLQEYLDKKGISSHGFKLLDQSGAAYHGRDQNTTQSKTQIYGSAAHKKILEPASFSQDFRYLPASVTRMSQTLRDEEKKGGFTYLKYAEGMELERWSKAVYENEDARNLLTHPDIQVEVSGFWEDPVWGILKKCRPDFIIPCLGIMGDLKTMTMKGKELRDVEEVFAKDVWKYKYHWQAAHNLSSGQFIDGVTYDSFIWIVIVKESPYEVDVIEPNAAMIYNGQEKVRKLTEFYAECEHTGIWPKRTKPGLKTISLPEYALNEE